MSDSPRVPPGAGKLPKMMIGFVIRRCTVALGRRPDAEELANWANNQEIDGGGFRLFGRPISVLEAGIILRHQARLVSAKSANSEERFEEIDEWLLRPAVETAKPDNVISLAAARERRVDAPKTRKRGKI